MARNASVRSHSGSGNWIGHTDIWNDPRAQLAPVTPAPVQVPATLPNINTITEKQMSYLKSLIDSRLLSTNEDTRTAAKGVKFAANKQYKEGSLSKAVASQLIAALVAVR